MEEASVPMRLTLDSVPAGEVKGRALLRLLDQMELLKGVVDHRLVLPRMDCDKTENSRLSTAARAGRAEAQSGTKRG